MPHDARKTSIGRLALEDLRKQVMGMSYEKFAEGAVTLFREFEESLRDQVIITNAKIEAICLMLVGLTAGILVWEVRARTGTPHFAVYPFLLFLVGFGMVYVRRLGLAKRAENSKEREMEYIAALWKQHQLGNIDLQVCADIYTKTSPPGKCLGFSLRRIAPRWLDS